MSTPHEGARGDAKPYLSAVCRRLGVSVPRLSTPCPQPGEIGEQHLQAIHHILQRPCPSSSRRGWVGPTKQDLDKLAIVPIWDYAGCMRIVAKKNLLAFCGTHAAARQSLLAWHEEAVRAVWTTPQDIKDRYASASFVGHNRVVFNIKGNAYRLIVAVAYRIGVVYIKFIGTHAEYDAIDAETIELES